MGLVSNWIEKRISNAVSKSHTSVGFSPSNRNLLQLFNDWTTGKKYVDLAKLLEWYETHPLVFEVIDNIDQAVSKIPLKVETSKGVEVKVSKILELLPLKLRSQVVASVESCGNGFLYFTQGVGFEGTSSAVEIDFWIASSVTITTSTVTGQITKYEYQPANRTTRIVIQGDDLKRVLQVRNTVITDNLPVDIGMSKLQPMKDVVESSKEKFVADTAMVKNGGVKGIVSNRFADMPLLEDARKLQQAQFDENTSGAHNFGGVHVTANSVDYTPIGASLADLKILEGIVENLRRLASAYHLSSVLFNDAANSKFDNMEEAIKQAYLNCYIPTAEKIYIPIFEWLSDLLGVDEVPSVDKTRIEVIKASTNEAAMILSAFDVRIQEMLMGQFTSEEVRDIFDMKPLTSTQTAIGVKPANTTGNGQ
ncbi:MAG: phage portal protein BeeE [Enterobacterales bacterium]|jgi:phage portal protein BeeE